MTNLSRASVVLAGMAMTLGRVRGLEAGRHRRGRRHGSRRIRGIRNRRLPQLAALGGAVRPGRRVHRAGGDFGGDGGLRVGRHDGDRRLSRPGGGSGGARPSRMGEPARRRRRGPSARRMRRAPSGGRSSERRPTAAPPALRAAGSAGTDGGATPALCRTVPAAYPGTACTGMASLRSTASGPVIVFGDGSELVWDGTLPSALKPYVSAGERWWRCGLGRLRKEDHRRLSVLRRLHDLHPGDPGRPIGGKFGSTTNRAPCCRT